MYEHTKTCQQLSHLFAMLSLNQTPTKSELEDIRYFLEKFKKDIK